MISPLQLTTKRWLVKPLPTATNQQIPLHAFANQLTVSPFLATLLVQRGVHTFEEAKSFFVPQLSFLHDPFLMQDMALAVSRLQTAIAGQEKILIFGDYDVDGTTSVALVYGFLRENFPSAVLDYYIPDRYTEGYGISNAGIEWAAENGFSLIVALDCGIKSIDKIQKANDLGVDFIICDHHRPGPDLPDAAAVLDPKRADCQYPFDELSGCGVGFKLLHAFCLQQNIPVEKLYPYLDLVAVSIGCDLVPITGENRVLAAFGLKVLNSQPRPGLKALIKVAGFKNALTMTDVVFGLGPRINAAGRIKHAKEAVRLLLAETETEADDFAMEINKHNINRREHDTGITEQVLQMIRQNEALKAAKTTVLYDPGWHKGVIGIVASRCIEQYHRPTIILTKSNGKVTGSGRSVPGFDLYEAVEACADLLEQFGGHTFAAGMTLAESNVLAFQERFEDVVSQSIQEEQLSPSVEIDMALDFDAIDAKFMRIIARMGPFGPQNLSPIFMTEGIRAVNIPFIMKEKHLKFTAKQANSNAEFTVIGWGMAALFEQVRQSDSFTIAYQIEENHYNGKVNLQLMLKDIKF
jgi:single-stranded-DNA-specific exonuclease